MTSVRSVASSRLVRGLGAMLAGGAVGQGLVVLVSPVLTRLYTPADFGVFAVFTAVVTTVATVSTLRLEVALVLPEHDEDAAAVAWTGATAALVISLAVGAIGIVAAAPLSILFGAPALAGSWWLVAATTFAVAGFQLLSAWIIREQRYAALGIRNVAQGVGTAGSQLGLGALGAGATGLLIGQALGYVSAVGGLTSRRGLLRQPRPTGTQMRDALSRYRRFPLVSSWSALLNVAGLQVPLLVISAAYGQIVVGLLGLTIRVISAPLVLLGRNVAQAFVGEASSNTRNRTGSLARQVRITTLALLAAGVLPTAALAGFGPSLFGLIFGLEWTEAGRYAQLLSVGFLAQLAVSPVSQTLLVLERQGAQLAWDVGRLVLTIGAPLCCAVLGASPAVAVATFSAALVISYAALLVTCLRAASRADSSRTTAP